MPIGALHTLCESLLSGLNPQDRLQLSNDAHRAFQVWRAQAVQVEPRGLRAGCTAQGGPFRSDADLIRQFAATLETSAPFLAERPVHVVASLVPQLSGPLSADDEAFFAAALAQEVAQERTDQALTRQAARVAPLRVQSAKIQEGRRLGGKASKRMPGLDSYLRERLAETPNATTEDLWRGLERHSSDAPLELEDAEIFRDGDELVSAGVHGERAIKFSAFKRYATTAREKKSQ